ncbi:MAG: hypothetical protein JWN03_3032 [Nocardia sp.]|uniref:hypothetical protein n=1 Tax=Nocardia sp. TaxID=1821 RepID=UPI00261CA91D|nr:hypothetical protein [Nocardia sp.]MCU1642757.1 hypothetical protein [Nocardia sp.]
MKLIWTAVPALIAAAAVAGCSGDNSTSSTASGSSTPTAPSTTFDPADHSDDDEHGGAVRVPLGETRKVLVPADAVMEIKVPASWGSSIALRCTATDAGGQRVELRPPDAVQPEQVREMTWTPLQTFSAPANAEVTVGCSDPATKIPPNDSITFIRVVPRGLMPGRG